VIPLYRPENIGTKEAFLVKKTFNGDEGQAFRDECLELIALNDERFLASYVNEEQVSEEQILSAMTTQVREAKLYPLFFGSAMTGIGVAELLTGVATFFPANTNLNEAPLSGVVFKLEKETSGNKVAYIRIFSGSLRVREDVSVSRATQEHKVE